MPTCKDDLGPYECSFADKFVLPAFDALDASPIAMAVKGSAMIVPWAGAIHLLALAALGGAVFIVDLRLLGGGVRSKTPAQLQTVAAPIMLTALFAAVVSGTILALGELNKLYYSPPYWMKMATFATAIAYTFLVRNKILVTDGRLSRSIAIPWVLLGLIWFAVFVMNSNWLARGALALFVSGIGIAVWRTRPSISKWEKLTAGAGAMSIALWLTTAAAGRWIAFY